MSLHTEIPEKYTITGLCALFGVSNQTYYKYNENATMTKVAQEEFVIQYVHEVRSRDHGIGGLKLWHMYQRRFGTNSSVGRDRFEDILDSYRDWETDRKSTRLNSSHITRSRMPSSA